MARHVRKGETVMITAGDHKGKTGEIMRVLTKKDAVLIKGVNLRTKHVKPTQQSPQGGIITREAPIHLSNVSPIDGSGKATRVRFTTKDDGSKVRVAASDGKELGVVRGAKAKA
ncbi:MAG: 50S ribosomal protein L24 [Planctomycetota bacterium]